MGRGGLLLFQGEQKGAISAQLNDFSREAGGKLGSACTEWTPGDQEHLGGVRAIFEYKVRLIFFIDLAINQE